MMLLLSIILVNYWENASYLLISKTVSGFEQSNTGGTFVVFFVFIAYREIKTLQKLQTNFKMSWGES